MSTTTRVQDRTEAAFTFVGEAVDVDYITAKLGLTPSRYYRKGEPFPRRPDISRRKGFWSLESALDPAEPLERHIQSLLDILENKNQELRHLRTARYAPRFYCGYFSDRDDNAGIDLSAQTLARIAALGAALTVGVYWIGSEDDE